MSILKNCLVAMATLLAVAEPGLCVTPLATDPTHRLWDLYAQVGLQGRPSRTGLVLTSLEARIQRVTDKNQQAYLGLMAHLNSAAAARPLAMTAGPTQEFRVGAPGQGEPWIGVLSFQPQAGDMTFAFKVLPEFRTSNSVRMLAESFHMALVMLPPVHKPCDIKAWAEPEGAGFTVEVLEAASFEQDVDGAASAYGGITIAPPFQAKTEFRDPKKRPFTDQASAAVTFWARAHITDPYPTDRHKETLAEMGNVAMSQIEASLINYRQRRWEGEAAEQGITFKSQRKAGQEPAVARSASSAASSESSGNVARKDAQPSRKRSRGAELLAASKEQIRLKKAKQEAPKVDKESDSDYSPSEGNSERND